MVELTDDHSIHGEYVADDKTGALTFHLLDKTMKESYPVEAETIELTTTPAKGDALTYELKAVRAEGSETASEFNVVDDKKRLVTDIKMAGKGVKVTLKMKHKGKDETFEMKIDDHGH